MLIARVIGELVATQKHPSHEGRKLLLVQPLNLDGSRLAAMPWWRSTQWMPGSATGCCWPPKASAP